MIDCGDGCKINAEHVTQLSWEHRHYANCGPESYLIVWMHDGRNIRIHHGFGVDAYKIEKAILDEQAKLIR